MAQIHLQPSWLGSCRRIFYGDARFAQYPLSNAQSFFASLLRDRDYLRT